MLTSPPMRDTHFISKHHPAPSEAPKPNTYFQRTLDVLKESVCSVQCTGTYSVIRSTPVLRKRATRSTRVAGRYSSSTYVTLHCSQYKKMLVCKLSNYQYAPMPLFFNSSTLLIGAAYLFQDYDTHIII